MALLLLLIVLAVLVLIGGAVAILVVISRHQKQSIAYDNQIVPGIPSNAPSSWAGSHDPEAKLHRRLRDAVRALRAVNAYDTAASVQLRAGLEQSAVAVDNHLVAIAGIPEPHRAPVLAEAATMVEAIESGVAQYASATTKPDPVAFESGLQGVQTSVDAITRRIQALGPGQSTSGQIGFPQPGAAGYPQPPGYAQPQPGGGYQQQPISGGYAQPSVYQQPHQGTAQPSGPVPGGPVGDSDPTIRRPQP
ncbi:hypothetical protein [Nocardia alni]|uniref:hypothetical protein n=1 Tax=Nocardia alni TaxID=2815723 RepID=UPI001C23A874|nr:hypothetical protein [Nocardia alni]